MNGEMTAGASISGSISAVGSISGSVSGMSRLSGALSVPSYSPGGELQPATTETLGGIIVGDDLSITAEGRLSVLKANVVEQDNTRPITAAAVYTEVGNINALLQTI